MVSNFVSNKDRGRVDNNYYRTNVVIEWLAVLCLPNAVVDLIAIFVDQISR
jgi:hypothetical protein